MGKSIEIQLTLEQYSLNCAHLLICRFSSISATSDQQDQPLLFLLLLGLLKVNITVMKTFMMIHFHLTGNIFFLPYDFLSNFLFSSLLYCYNTVYNTYNTKNMCWFFMLLVSLRSRLLVIRFMSSKKLYSIFQLHKSRHPNPWAAHGQTFQMQFCKPH